MTLSEFRIRFPEFEPTDDDLVTAKLAAAELTVADSWDDDLRDEIVALTAAAEIAVSPQGRAAQLVSKKGLFTSFESTYSRRLQTLQQQHACCYLRNG